MYAKDLIRKNINSRKHGKSYLADYTKLNYPHWFIPYCHLAMHTGLRPGDLYSLTWEELNLQYGRLIKECEKSHNARRRNRQPAIVDMKLNSTIKNVLEKWHEDLGKPDKGLVFPSPVTGTQLDKQAHRKPWNHVKEFGEFDMQLDFYALRHHFISAQLANGVPIFTVAKLAGHKSIDMIAQHYGHQCPDRAIEAIDIITSSLFLPAK